MKAIIVLPMKEFFRESGVLSQELGVGSRESGVGSRESGVGNLLPRLEKKYNLKFTL
jgi:hypothetical protein